jgi:hypothetical protein
MPHQNESLRRSHLRKPRVDRVAGLCSGKPGAGAGARIAAPAANPRPEKRGRLSLHRQHALHQHDSGGRSSRPFRATERSNAASRAWSAGTPWPWWCGPTASSGIGGHISTYASAATLYEVGFNHFFRAPTTTSGDIWSIFQGHAVAGHLRAGLHGRSARGQTARELSPRAQPRGRAFLLSPPLPDARVLAVSHGLHGTGPLMASTRRASTATWSTAA